MNSNRTLVRWGALTLLVMLMSGCCIAPWGGRYHGGGYYQDGYGGGGREHGGGDHDRGDRGDRGDHGGGGWHH